MKHVQQLDRVIIRFAGDSGDGMQLTGDRFTFLGARQYLYPRSADGSYAAEEPQVVEGSSLGVLRDRARPVRSPAAGLGVLPSDLLNAADWWSVGE